MNSADAEGDKHERTHAEIALERLRRLHQGISRIRKTIARASSEAELFAAVCRAAVEQGSFALAAVVAIDAATGNIEPQAHCAKRRGGSTADSLLEADAELLREVAGATVRTGRRQVCNDVAQDAPTAACKDLALRGGYRSVASFPIVRHARIFGALLLGADEAEGFWPDEVDLLASLAADLDFAMDALHSVAVLRASQRRNALILHSLSEGIHVLDAAGRIVVENPAAVAMFGWQSNEMHGQNGHSVVHHHRQDGDEYPVEDCPIYRSLRDGLTRKVAGEVFFRKDGSSFPVEYACSQLRDESGAIAGVVVSFRDVTEQKESAIELRETQERYRHLFEEDLTGNFVCDPRGRLLLCNRSFAHIHGYASAAEALATAPPLFRADGWRQATTATNPAESLADTRERWVDRRDGSAVLVLERLVDIRDASGRLTAVQGYHLDITARRDAEESIRAQAALISNAQRIGRMGSWSLDLADETMIWSDAACALFGIAPEEFLGTRAHFYSFVLPEDRPRLAADYARVVASGGLLDVESEFRIRTPSGEMRWMMVRGNAHIGADDTIGRRFGMYMDVTERKRAEERVLRLNRVHALLSALNSSLLRVRDRQTLFDIACRVAVETGKMRATWIGVIGADGATVRAVSQAGDLQKYHELVHVTATVGPYGGGPFGTAMRDGRPAVCNDIEHDPAFAPWREIALQRGFKSIGVFPLKLDGRTFGGIAHYSDVPNFFDGEEVRILDELAANISFAVDFIEQELQRRAAEAALRESEDRFRAMYEQAALGICLVSLDLRFTRVNKRFCEIVGRDAHELLGAASWVDAAHADDRPAAADAVARLLAGATSVTLKNRYVRRDQHAVWVRSTLSVLRSARGEPASFISVIEDISGRLELEEQLRRSQRLESIGQLTGGVAHDFNNLLTVILGNAETLAGPGGGGPEQRLLAETIAAAAQRGAELTRRLLAFARLQPLRPRALDVNELVGSLDDLQRRTLGEHIEIEFALAADLWTALVDPGQLDSALLNLTINARDAMPDGGRLTIVTANVTLDEDYAERHADVQAGQYVLLAVSDSGIGIPAKDLDRVFEPFFTTKEIGKGTGLGLAMVYGFIRQSGGHIDVCSEVGRGTTVKMYLPRAMSQCAETAVPDAPVPVPTGTGTILLVEDDEMVRRYAREQLISLGYHVLEAGSGPQALQRIARAGRIDLLFTDVVMPGGMTGRQLADEALRLCPGLKVLYTSGYAENALTHHGRLDPGIHLLAKPYRRADLAAEVRAALA